ncbi:MAG: hypothetical protein WC179_07360 [Candidatus Cloacimonadaceae bacterium]
MFIHRDNICCPKTISHSCHYHDETPVSFYNHLDELQCTILENPAI